MPDRTLFKFLNIFAVIATIAINVLANALPLNNQNTGEIANRFDVYFLPAGYVFSIWGLIYIGLIAFAIFQALPGQQDNPRLRKADIPFLLSCVGNVVWLFLWHYNQYVLSMIPILLLLVSLMAVYLAFEIGLREVPAAEKWMAHVPFALYLGWASVAVIANTTAVLDYIGFSGLGLSEQAWTLIMLIVGTILGLIMALRRNDVIFNLVLAWAFTGIGVRQFETPSVALTAYATAGLALIWAVLAWVRGRQSGSTLPAS